MRKVIWKTRFSQFDPWICCYSLRLPFIAGHSLFRYIFVTHPSPTTTEVWSCWQSICSSQSRLPVNSFEPRVPRKGSPKWWMQSVKRWSCWKLCQLRRWLQVLVTTWWRLKQFWEKRSIEVTLWHMVLLEVICKLHHDLVKKRLDPSIHSSTNKLSFPGEGCNYTTYQSAAVLLWDWIKSPQIVYITITLL